MKLQDPQPNLLLLHFKSTQFTSYFVFIRQIMIIVMTDNEYYQSQTLYVRAENEGMPSTIDPFYIKESGRIIDLALLPSESLLI